MRGATLVELLVVLLLLGVMAGVTAFAVAGLRPPLQRQGDVNLDSARTAAVVSGQAVTLTRDGGAAVRFLPDGRVLGAGLDPFTGGPLDASR